MASVDIASLCSVYTVHAMTIRRTDLHKFHFFFISYIYIYFWFYSFTTIFSSLFSLRIYHQVDWSAVFLFFSFKYSLLYPFVFTFVCESASNERVTRDRKQTSSILILFHTFFLQMKSCLLLALFFVFFSFISFVVYAQI